MPRAEAMLTEHAARLAAQAQTAAVCLDFDGTLAPIVDDPNEARLLPGTVELLGHLAARFAAVALLITWPSTRRPRDFAISGCTGCKRSATATYG